MVWYPKAGAKPDFFGTRSHITSRYIDSFQHNFVKFYLPSFSHQSFLSQLSSQWLAIAALRGKSWKETISKLWREGSMYLYVMCLNQTQELVVEHLNETQLLLPEPIINVVAPYNAKNAHFFRSFNYKPLVFLSLKEVLCKLLIIVYVFFSYLQNHTNIALQVQYI